MSKTSNQGEAVTCWFGASVTYPTSDGRLLRFPAGTEIEGALSLRRAYPENDPDPEDEDAAWEPEVYAADLRVADADGRIWRTTSHFTSAVFVAEMLDFSRLDDGGALTSVVPVKARRRKPEPSLRASYLTDDRAGRELIVSRREPGRRLADRVVVPISGKYLGIAFEVYIVPAGEEPAALRVEIVEGSLVDARTGDDLGRFAFTMPWRELFRQNDMARDAEGRWRGCDLPLPVVFSPESNSGTPQEGVTVLGLSME